MVEGFSEQCKLNCIRVSHVTVFTVSVLKIRSLSFSRCERNGFTENLLVVVICLIKKNAQFLPFVCSELKWSIVLIIPRWMFRTVKSFSAARKVV